MTKVFSEQNQNYWQSEVRNKIQIGISFRTAMTMKVKGITDAIVMRRYDVLLFLYFFLDRSENRSSIVADYGSFFVPFDRQSGNGTKARKPRARSKLLLRPALAGRSMGISNFWRPIRDNHTTMETLLVPGLNRRR